MNSMTDTGRDPAEESRAFEYRIGDDETVIEAVLHTVSEVTDRRFPPGVTGPRSDESGVDGAKMAGSERRRTPPLYDVVDPDALVTLSSSSTTDVTITFSYAGCRVTVVGTDAVLVNDSSPPTDSGD